MPKLGTVELTGESGKKYSFNIWKRDTEFNSIGALYVMARDDGKGEYSLIYIGETGDLSDRPLNHHKTSCFDRHKADTLFIRAAPNEAQRLTDETDLRGAYETPCNDQ